MAKINVPLQEAAQSKWHKLRGSKLLADVIEGVVFNDGIREEKTINQQDIAV